MRNLPVAFGNSCFAKTWPNKTIAFDELCARLEQTIRTTESVEEYQKMPKAERDRIKDKGGFVGGQLRDNRRKREYVTCRSMLTLDCDHADAGFIARFLSGCKYTACLYTTHGHTPEAPRVRVIVPMTRDVTPDEFVAISRYFADEWGIDQFDECSYRPHQLMYWPTTPANGEYVFQRVDGAWLDPDVYLAAHPNWKDCSLLPTSSRESAVREGSKKPQEDPFEKRGVVGAFCRAYTIEEAMETFLPDVYEPSVMDGRFDYIPADSSAGVVVYDGKFAYSHHATDPACGRLLNAFDLVRLHRFRDLDDKCPLDTPIGKLPSFSAMSEFAIKDELVKSVFAEERKAQAEQEFADEDWENALELEKNGRVKDTLDNIVLILDNDPKLAVIGYNELKSTIDFLARPAWQPIKYPTWTDNDTSQLRVYLS
ncbi:MAG: hypothetical protein ABFC56_05775, partial [Clostridiaceae bacterium]